MHKKAIFFDRDGVINYRLVGEYVKNLEEFNIIPDLFNFFEKVKKHDYLAIIITNQQGIGKKIMNEKELAMIHNEMQEILKAKTGYVFDDILYCSDLNETNSFRRKPNPGMILEAINKWNIDAGKSFMIGDRKSDILAGKNAGVKTILIGNNPSVNDINPDFHYLNFYQISEFLN
jgi:D-glycero-D-manno-heptose 1,7-bisphosphate phosphatase